MKSNTKYNPEPHRESIKLMRARGVSVDDIAAALGISVSTIRRNHKHDLQHGKLMTDNFVESQLMKLIKAGNARAIHFYLSRRVDCYKNKEVPETITMLPPIFSTLEQDQRDFN